MDSQLIEATWGLVGATSLLFLVTAVPAVGQFVEWASRKKALAAEIIPSLHVIRAYVREVQSELLSLKWPASLEDVEPIYSSATRIKVTYKEAEEVKGMSLDQRLEMQVLGMQIYPLHFHLSFIISSGSGDLDTEEGSVISDEERYRQAIVYTQAALISLGRLDRLFIGPRKKYGGRTFTEEMEARSSQVFDEGARQIVDIRRNFTGP